MYYRFKIEKQATSKATLNLKYGKLPNNVRYQTFCKPRTSNDRFSDSRTVPQERKKTMSNISNNLFNLGGCEMKKQKTTKYFRVNQNQQFFPKLINCKY